MRSLRWIFASTAIVLVAGCVPAHLEKISAKTSHQDHVALESDLVRAFNGAEDPAAKDALGEWLSGPAAKEQSSDYRISSGEVYHIHFARKAASVYSRGEFERLEAASHFEVKGIRHASEPGTGVPMLGYRPNLHHDRLDPWFPPEGIYRCVTAVAFPLSNSRSNHEVEIRLMDPMARKAIETRHGRERLAADFTVPWAGLLQTAQPLGASGITSVLRQHSSRASGFFLMQDYDPNRTPVIFIHGLFSTPLAWGQITNEIWADPELRKRYQVWHYLYPTHDNALYAARVMRGQLDELRRTLDPTGRDPAMQRSVVVAHSMGGLLAKTLVVEPKEAFWNTVFTRPMSQLNATPQERATLKEAFYWEPRAHVDRVVYCSVPFRGSDWATSFVGRLGELLVAQDPAFQDFYKKLEKKNPGMLRPDYQLLTQGKVSSVLALTPRQKSMEILADLHPVPGVTTHVITGSHDHFVRPESSRIPYADSALEVDSGHGSFHHPAAVAEILRILRLPPVKTQGSSGVTSPASHHDP